MNEAQVIGYAVSVIITLGAFVAVIQKFTQPINELKIVIQKLNDNIDALKTDSINQNRRIEKHGEEIENLDKRVGKIETKIDLYHNQNN